MLQLGGGWAPAGVRVVTLTFQGKTFQTPPHPPCRERGPSRAP